MSFFNRLQKLTTEELKEISVLCGGLSLLVGAVLILSGSVALPDWKNLSFSTTSQTATLYNAAGTQSYVVPAGVTSLEVHLWGAGGSVTSGAILGSCDGYTVATVGSTPGGAGYTTATIPVTPGETLTVVVGAVNGGGTGAGSGAGAGGGYSGIFRGTPSQANAIVIAGGGGGSGAYVFKVSGDCPYGLGYWGNFPGGHGGGSSGGATTGATGGTQVAGGTGNQSGGALSGGNGTLTYTGGGGAGYWGGGSGTNVPPHYGFGGGGGSGYCSPLLSSCSTVAATVTGVAAMSSLAPSGAGNASKAGAVALLIPNISLSASPQVIATGQNTTLNWAATGVQTNSCNIAGVASGINAEGWVVPANWNNANNTIEVIGGGGGGGGADVLSADGAGGGGGAYSKAVNVTLTPGAYVAYKVGSGGAGGTGGGDVDNGGSAPVAGGVGGDTYFCNSTSNCSSISGSAVLAGAKGGSGGPGGETTSMTQGGQAASGVGVVKYSGGQGGMSYNSGTGSPYPGGGGGAAGLNGAGANAHGGSLFELGGNGDAGFGGAGSATRGSPGGNGAEWGSGYGSGGGGAAGAVVEGSPGAAGGLYGAGGGGGNAGGMRTEFGGTGGAGKQGLVVITYTPSGGSLQRIFLTSAGTPAPSGTVATPVLTASTTFTLTCITTAEGFPVSTSTTVTVSPPGLSISASPTGVAPSGTSQISWTANGIRTNSCTVSQLTPANIASMFSALGGGDNTNKTTAALSQTGSYTYKLACTPLYTSGTNGTLVGSPTTGVAGKYGQAVTFGTSPSYLAPASAITLGSSPWTIATWFNYPLVTGISYNTLTRGSSDHQVIVQRSNMHLGTFNNTGGVFVDSGYVISALSAGWHHLAAVGSGSATSFYIDGALVGTSAFKSATNIVAIGNYQGGGQQWGTVDDFRIYNRALSSDEVATLYQGAHVTTSLLAYWPFDTDTLSGTTFYNLAGGMTSTTTTVTVSSDLCTDIPGAQVTVPTGCQTPDPSPGICIPPGKTWNGSQCVAVALPSGISLSSTRVRKGDSATLNWTVTGMSAGISCSMSPSLPGGMPAWDSLDPWYGTGTTGAIAASTLYTLTCGNGVASTSAATTVGLLPLFQEI